MPYPTTEIQTNLRTWRMWKSWKSGILSPKTREEKYRKALAHYDHYKEERLLMGDEEVEEEL
jgi:hypothetical protein